MSYQVLARKWRPKNFRETVGQEHVLQALVNALDNDRLHHAYLFTGTRGVGKTTIARILAKCLNCEAGVSSEPCGTCSSCMEIAEGRSIDLIEVDAASRTKVEDTRELLENVQYLPTHCRYKVYLIDEVHMLSTSSFNALLKTLEEPPPHVKFLLATTDPQKLPATVLSRCLQFNLKNMPAEQIVGHLGNVLEQEMVTFEEPALWLLGRAAAGSMRDALSLTDQALGFGAGKVLEDDVRSMLGTVDLGFVHSLLKAVCEGAPEGVLEAIARMAEHAADFEGCLDELLSLLHRVAIAQAVPAAVDNSWGDAEQITSLAQVTTAEDIQLFYQMALNGKRDIALSPDARRGFEMILLRMLAFRPAAVLDEGLDASDLQEMAVSETAVGEVGATVKKSPEPVAAAQAPAKHVIAAQPVVEQPVMQSLGVKQPIVKSLAGQKPDASIVVAASEAPRVVAQRSTQAAPEPVPVAVTPGIATAALSLDAVSTVNWSELLEMLGLAGIVYNVASHCELQGRAGSNFQFVLDQGNASLFNDSHSEKLRLALENYFSCTLSVSVTPGQVHSETPAMRTERLAQERQREAVVSIEGDSQLQALISRFDGELDRSSIFPTDV